jgi:hypothetical protein
MELKKHRLAIFRVELKETKRLKERGHGHVKNQNLSLTPARV